MIAVIFILLFGIPMLTLMFFNTEKRKKRAKDFDEEQKFIKEKLYKKNGPSPLRKFIEANSRCNCNHNSFIHNNTMNNNIINSSTIDDSTIYDVNTYDSNTYNGITYSGTTYGGITYDGTTYDGTTYDINNYNSTNYDGTN